ncbi:MAG: hypothetical protein ACE5KG_05220 [Nitrososphaerales archaeon]
MRRAFDRMVFSGIKDGNGVIEVGAAEAKKLDKYFQRLLQEIDELDKVCERIFVCFPDTEGASRFRTIYEDKGGQLSEHDFKTDNEVIIKFIMK